jgi:hypothetical protein
MAIAKPINLAERRKAIEAARRNGNRQLYGQLAGKQIQINDEFGELVGYANLPSEAAIEVLHFIGWTTAQVWQRAIELALPDAFDFYFDKSAEEGEVIAFDMPADVASWRTGGLTR